MLQLSASAAPAAFDALSGEVYASASTVMQQQSIYLREAVGTRVRQGLAGQSGGGQSTAKLAPGYDATVWAQGYGGWGQVAGDGNAASLDSSIAGFLMGVDAAVTSSARVGLVGGYSRSTLNVNSRSSSGDIDNYDVGLYGGTQFGALSLFGARPTRGTTSRSTARSPSPASRAELRRLQGGHRAGVRRGGVAGRSEQECRSEDVRGGVGDAVREPRLR